MQEEVWGSRLLRPLLYFLSLPAAPSAPLPESGEAHIRVEHFLFHPSPNEGVRHSAEISCPHNVV